MIVRTFVLTIVGAQFCSFTGHPFFDYLIKKSLWMAHQNHPKTNPSLANKGVSILV